MPNKAERKQNKIGRIAKRKGISEEDAGKIAENRYARRREIFSAPETESGEFTKKLRPSDIKKAETTSKTNSPTQLPEQPATGGGFQNTSVGDTGQGFLDRTQGLADSIKSTIEIKPDLTDITSNATALYRKKMGY